MRRHVHSGGADSRRIPVPNVPQWGDARVSAGDICGVLAAYYRDNNNNNDDDNDDDSHHDYNDKRS